MDKRGALRIAALLALAYYWIWPGVRLMRQVETSSAGLNATVESLPRPEIRKVLVVPSYDLQYDGSPGERVQTFRRKIGTATVLILGRRFKSLDEAHPQNAPAAILGGQSFTPSPHRDVEFQDSLMELEVDSSLLPRELDQTTEVTVVRDGKSSDPFPLSGAEVSRQLAAERRTSAVVLDAIPAGYPLTPYSGDSPKVLFMVAGFPLDEIRLAEKSLPCSYTIDGDSFDCLKYGAFRNPNFFAWPVHPGEPQHSVSLTLNGVESAPYSFDTREFEQYGRERRAARNGYYRNLTARRGAAGGPLPLLGQSKNGSLPSLGVNVLLTLLMLGGLRPWRHAKASRWVFSFVAPVALQAMAGILVGLTLFLMGVFVGPVIGTLLAAASLGASLIPLAQAAVIGILLAHSVPSPGRSVA